MKPTEQTEKCNSAKVNNYVTLYALSTIMKKSKQLFQKLNIFRTTTLIMDESF